MRACLGHTSLMTVPLVRFVSVTVLPTRHEYATWCHRSCTEASQGYAVAQLALGVRV
jgi:hypothetical protein